MNLIDNNIKPNLSKHWTTLLTYWWMGIGMIAVTIFLMYNFLFSYAMVHSTDVYSRKAFHTSTIKPAAKELFERPKVLMHIFLNDKEELNWDDYLPYIKIITNKYTNFQYELIVVSNDTVVDASSMSDNENNEQALNTIMTGDDFKYYNLLPGRNNLHLRYTTLSQYLHDSPLKKYWNTLPYQFTRFLVRAVSIWEKGGIAFDPLLLTPQTPHSLYIDKIINILQNYKTVKEKPKSMNRKNMKSNKFTRKVNNIRDIINELSREVETPTDKSYQDSLIEAETKNNSTILMKRHLLMSALDNTNLENTTNNLNTKDTQTVPFSEPIMRNDYVLKSESENKKEQHSSLPKTNLLPLFLNYLFHNEQIKQSDETSTHTLSKAYDETTTSTVDHTQSKSLKIKNFESTVKNVEHYKPVIISAKGIFETTNVIKPTDATVSENQNLYEVTIDLKGNIIVTDTPCHAFIGGMFSNAIHHDRSESVTDFIIKELSIFCQGLLTSCVGIDVILL